MPSPRLETICLPSKGRSFLGKKMKAGISWTPFSVQNSAWPVQSRRANTALASIWWRRSEEAYFEGKGSALELDESSLRRLIVREIEVHHHTSERVLCEECIEGLRSEFDDVILLRSKVSFLWKPGDLLWEGVDGRTKSSFKESSSLRAIGTVDWDKNKRYWVPPSLLSISYCKSILSSVPTFPASTKN